LVLIKVSVTDVMMCSMEAK